MTRRLTQFNSEESGTSISNYSPLTGSAHRGTFDHLRQRGNHGRMKAGPKHLNKLRQFIAHHPNVLSQIKPTIHMMLKAYGVEISHTTDDRLSQTYVWSEVFPVIKSISLWPEASQHHSTAQTLNHSFRAQQTARTQEHYQVSHNVCERGGRAMQLDNGCDGGKPVLQRCYDTTAAAQVMVTVKLPKITSSRLTQT